MAKALAKLRDSSAYVKEISIFYGDGWRECQIKAERLFLDKDWSMLVIFYGKEEVSAAANTDVVPSSMSKP